MLGLALVALSACAQPTATLVPPHAASPTLAAETPATSPPRVATSTETSSPPPTSPTPASVTPIPAIHRAPADWPMFRFNLNRTGYNPTESVLRPPLELKWQFDAKGKI